MAGGARLDARLRRRVGVNAEDAALLTNLSPDAGGPPRPVLETDRPVALVGGGGFDWETFHRVRSRVGAVVAADGGANHFRPEAGLFGEGSPLAAIIGDMDSVTALEEWRRLPDCRVAPIAEQDTTDLEKCLYSVAAPLYLGVGFLGRRFDHTLAATHALLRYADRQAILIGETDLIFMSPLRLSLRLAPGARVSIYPVGPTTGVASTGLEWPIDGLDFAPGHRIGASNRAAAERVSVAFDRPGAAIILHRDRLDAAIEGLMAASGP